MIDSTGGLFNISNKKLTGMHTVHHITFAQGDCIYIVDDATGIKLAGVSNHWYNREGVTSVTIPENVPVNSIASCAFRNCTSLTSVTIPDTVTQIGSGAFYKCESLTGITIPDGVTYIGGNAFRFCDGLTSIIIPDSVAEIKYKAFANCTNLKSVTIGSGVTKLNLYAFAGCPNLSSLTIPSTVTEITNSFYQNGPKSASFKNLTIYGEAGSCAEAYAQKNGYRFVASGAPNQNDTPDWSTNVPSQSSIPVENTGIPSQSDIPVKDTSVPNQNNVSIESVGAAQTASGWARAEVASAIAAGLVPGSLQLRYQSNITREEFCRLMTALVEKATGKDINSYVRSKGLTITAPFTDTNTPEVLAAYALGIVKGSGAMFNPNGSITRQEAAAMLARTARVLGLSAGTPVRFADAGTISSWAAGEVDHISGITDPGTGRQVMGGVGSQRFEPLGNYTREQAIATALRLYGAAAALDK
ncbi:MAG: leucine-rich repeat protein [Clostridiales bacterium]|nr:leucine-rich repeat protein [Clostridiales bacterium]